MANNYFPGMPTAKNQRLTANSPKSQIFRKLDVLHVQLQ